MLLPCIAHAVATSFAAGLAICVFSMLKMAVFVLRCWRRADTLVEQVDLLVGLLLEQLLFDFIGELACVGRWALHSATICLNVS